MNPALDHPFLPRMFGEPEDSAPTPIQNTDIPLSIYKLLFDACEQKDKEIANLRAQLAYMTQREQIAQLLRGKLPIELPSTLPDWLDKPNNLNHCAPGAEKSWRALQEPIGIVHPGQVCRSTPWPFPKGQALCRHPSPGLPVQCNSTEAKCQEKE